MGALDGLATVDAGAGRFPYLAEGRTRFQIDECHQFTSRDRMECSVVVGTVLESTGEKNVPGEKRTLFFKENPKYPTMYPQKVKQFLLAATDADPDEITTDLANQMIPVVDFSDGMKPADVATPLKGVVIEVQGDVPEGKTYVRHSFSVDEPLS